MEEECLTGRDRETETASDTPVARRSAQTAKGWKALLAEELRRWSLSSRGIVGCPATGTRKQGPRLHSTKMDVCECGAPQPAQAPAENKQTHVSVPEVRGPPHSRPHTADTARPTAPCEPRSCTPSAASDIPLSEAWSPQLSNQEVQAGSPRNRSLHLSEPLTPPHPCPQASCPRWAPPG